MRGGGPGPQEHVIRLHKLGLAHLQYAIFAQPLAQAPASLPSPAIPRPPLRVRESEHARVQRR